MRPTSAFLSLLLATQVSCTGTVSSSRGEFTGVGLDGAEVDSEPLMRAGPGLDFATGGLEEHIDPFGGMLSLKLIAYRIGDYLGSVRYVNDGFYYQAVANLRQSQAFARNYQWAYGRGLNGLPQGWNQPWFAEWRMSAGEAQILFADGHTEQVFGTISLGEQDVRVSREVLAQRSRTTSSGAMWEPVQDVADGPTSIRYTDSAGTVYVFDQGDCAPPSARIYGRDAYCYPSRIEDVSGNGVQITYYGARNAPTPLGTSIPTSGMPRIVETFRTDDAGARSVIGRAYFYARGQAAGILAEPLDQVDHPFIEAIAYPGPNSNPLTSDATWHVTRFRFEDYGDPNGGENVGGFYDSVESTQRGCVARFADVSEVASIDIEGHPYAFRYGGGCPRVGPNTPAFDRYPGRLAAITLPSGPSIHYEYQQYQGTSEFGPGYDFRPRRYAPLQVGVNIDLAGVVLSAATGGDIVSAAINSLKSTLFGTLSSVRQRPPQNLPPQVIASRSLRDVAPNQGRDRSNFVWNLRHYTTRVDGVSAVAAVVTEPGGASVARIYQNLAPLHSPDAAKAGALLSHRAYNYSADLRATTFAGALASAPISQTDYGYAVYAAGSTNAFPPVTTQDGASVRVNQAEWLGWVVRPAFTVAGRNARTRSPSAQNCCIAGQIDNQRFGCSTRTLRSTNPAPLCFENDFEDAPEPGFPQYRSELGTQSILCTRSAQSRTEPRCPDGAEVVSSYECQDLGVCEVDTATYSNRALVTLYRDNANRIGLHSFDDTQRRDYDHFGNAAFVQRFGLEGGYQIARNNRASRASAAPCVRLTLADAGSRRRWDCNEDFAFQQDALTLESAPIESTESRFEYLREQLRTGRDPYLGANITGLVTRERTCVTGTACEVGNGLLTETRRSYDNAEMYPFQDAPGDLSTSALGRLTRVTRVLLEEPQNSPIRAINYYGRANVSDNAAGDVAEVADFVDQEISAGWARQRFSYAGNAPAVATSPTREWHIDLQGRAWLLGSRRFNGWGLLLQSTDENGAVRHLCYDERGRVRAAFAASDRFDACPSSDTDEVPAASAVTIYRDQPGDLSTLEISRARTNGQPLRESRAAVFFDSLGRLQQTRVQVNGRILASTSSYWQTSGLPLATTMPFVAQGGLDTISRPEEIDGISTHARMEFAYDALGRQTSQSRVHQNGQRETVTQEYPENSVDLLWNEMRTSSPSGVTVSRHDIFGRSTQSRSAAGDTLRMSYNALGMIESVVHPDGLASTYEYDSLARVTRHTQPERGAISLAYDRLSNVASISRANGSITQVSTDSRGRISSRGGMRASERPDTDVRYVYDQYPSDSPVSAQARNGRGRVVAILSAATRTDVGYDIEGNPVEYFQTLPGVGQKRMDRTFDSAGELQTAVYQGGYLDELRFHPQASSEGALQSLSASFGGRENVELFRLQYGPLGNVESRTLLPRESGALQTENWTYDEFGVVTQYNDPANMGSDAFAFRIGTRAPQRTAARADGLPVEIEWARRGTSGNVSRAAYTFEYDQRLNMSGAHFLSYENGAWQNNGTHSLTAQYDSVGNIRELTRTRGNGVPSTTRFQYDQTQRRLLSSTGARNDQFAYDASGNLRENAEWGQNSRVTYTRGNQVESIAAGIQRTRMQYGDSLQPVRLIDEALQRCSDPTCDYATVRDRSFARDLDGSSIAEYNTQTGQLLRLNLPGFGYYIPSGVEQPEGMYATLADQVGSVRVVLYEKRGQVVESRDFDPFGEELSERTELAPSSQPASFASYRRQDTFGASYFLAGARLYHPGIGRFLQQDPLGAFDPWRNGYTYAGNRPHLQSDPRGMDPPAAMGGTDPCPPGWNCGPTYTVTAPRMPPRVGVPMLKFVQTSRSESFFFRQTQSEVYQIHYERFGDRTLPVIDGFVGLHQETWVRPSDAIQTMDGWNDPVVNIILGAGSLRAAFGSSGTRAAARGGSAFGATVLPDEHAMASVLQGLNNTGATGYTNNCGRAVLAFFQRLRGNVGAVAEAGHALEHGELIELLVENGFKAARFRQVQGYAGIAEAMAMNRTAVIYSNVGGKVGHYFTAVKSTLADGRTLIEFFDPQLGGFVNPAFLRGDLHFMSVAW